MNSQREVIYKKRKHALFGERLAVDISNMMYEVGEQMINEFQELKDYEGFKMELLKNLSVEAPYDDKEFFSLSVNKMADEIFELVYKNYRDKSKVIAEHVLPVVKDVYENQPQYENIAIPITDGKKTMQVVANLKRAVEDEGREVILSIEKGISLAMIDEAWKEHLRELDDLKQSVQNVTYEQKDPLVIYKLESFELFRGMLNRVNKDISSFLIKGKLPIQDASSVKEARVTRGLDRSRMKEQRNDLLSQAHSDTQGPRKAQPVKREKKKIGRNDMVKVQYSDGRILTAKYKKVEIDLQRGNCQLVN
jgi:preprotein translocase subunit SecA